jgi:hypothetical protein
VTKKIKITPLRDEPEGKRRKREQWGKKGKSNNSERSGITEASDL